MARMTPRNNRFSGRELNGMSPAVTGHGGTETNKGRWGAWKFYVSLPFTIEICLSMD